MENVIVGILLGFGLLFTVATLGINPLYSDIIFYVVGSLMGAGVLLILKQRSRQ